MPARVKKMPLARAERGGHQPWNTVSIRTAQSMGAPNRSFRTKRDRMDSRNNPVRNKHHSHRPCLFWLVAYYHGRAGLATACLPIFHLLMK